MFPLALIELMSNTSKQEPIPTRLESLVSIDVTTVRMRHVQQSAQPLHYSPVQMESLTLMMTDALAVSHACKHVPTTLSTLIPTKVLLPNATIVPIASNIPTNQRVSSCAPLNRLFLVT
jgi:hypothetical protein